jgi:hypothetical protein
MSALLKRSHEGGIWHGRGSLAQTGFWLRSLGRLSAVRHPAMLSETPPHWARPSVPLGTHPPVWPV